MKNDKIADAYETIQPSSEAKNRVLEKIKRKQYRKRPLLKSALAFAATAAVICMAIFGNMFLRPQSNNIFSIKAYAMELQEDGSVELREVDLVNETDVWGGYDDGEYFYLNVGLKCEGENIKSVEFTIDNGFFAKQYIKRENGKIVTENVPMLYVGETNIIAMYGFDFEMTGNTITLDKDEMTEDLLLFIARESSYFESTDDKPVINIRAFVTFSDGKKQEETVTIKPESSIGIAGIGKINPDEIEKSVREGTDMAKLTDTFVEEAKNNGFKKVKVNNIELYDYTQALWVVSFDAIPETDFSPSYITGEPDKDGWLNGIIIYCTLSVYNDEYTVNIIGPEPIDVMKLLNAFTAEAQNNGIDDMFGLSHITLYDYDQNIWYISYKVRPENETDPIVIRSFYFNLSIDNDEYTVNIIGTEP